MDVSWVIEEFLGGSWKPQQQLLSIQDHWILTPEQIENEAQAIGFVRLLWQSEPHRMVRVVKVERRATIIPVEHRVPPVEH